MGIGQTALVGAIVLGIFVLLVVIGATRLNRRKPRDLSDTIADQIAAAEQTYRTELRAAPVVGVPYVAVTDDGSHDLYPHMSDAARDVCIGYLDTLFAAPARERTS